MNKPMSHSAHYIAVGLLARRDYSRHQVKSKLSQKGYEPLEIEQALDRCEASGFLDDNRYAELLVRSHISKGHGPTRIRQAIAQKGVAKDIIAAAIDASDCDWFELAKQKAQKKYQSKQIIDHKDKAKRIRYLLGQGFGYDQVAYALEYDPYDE